MKAALSFVLLFALPATTAFAQSTPFQHIIILFQENRTPDNLFQTLCPLSKPCSYEISAVGPTPSGQLIQLTPDPLYDDLDPDHSHNISFVREYNNGGINQGPKYVYCTTSSYCCANNDAFCKINGQWVYNWLHYVNNDAFTYNGKQYNRLDPYLAVAQQYGWGNYMFQSNQGPSFPGHQFMFAGTSAPGAPGTTTFFAENPNNQKIYDSDTGCAGTTNQNGYVPIIDSNGNENTSAFPCVDHPTMSDLIEGASLSWRYYANQPNGIWTAPNAISHICNPITNGVPNECSNQDFTTHVYLGPVGQRDKGPGHILVDLGADGQGNCNLPSVSWAIPDGTWSDHAGKNQSKGYGPAWVADIVDAVGGVYYDSNGNQHSTGCNYWNNTAIFITWDDWGGWYDHIIPPIAPLPNMPSQFGKGYLYGFRVPLIVVSAFTQLGTISGSDVSNFNAQSYCDSRQQTSIYCHDFGSILNYVEHNFNLPTIDRSQGGGYDDKWAPDSQYNGNQPLSEFFNLSTARTFQPIPSPVPASCFITPDGNCFTGYTGPEDPDDDANDQ